MSTWKDATSYSRGEDRTPRTHELRAHHIRIVVTRMHGCGDAWFLRCHDLGIDARELSSPDLDECKALAVETVRVLLQKTLGALDAVSP